jgi:hypothetical protein
MYGRGITWSYVSDVIRRMATQILQMCANNYEDPGMDVLVEECTSHTLALLSKLEFRLGAHTLTR